MTEININKPSSKTSLVELEVNDENKDPKFEA